MTHIFQILNMFSDIQSRRLGGENFLCYQRIITIIESLVGKVQPTTTGDDHHLAGFSQQFINFDCKKTHLNLRHDLI